jgi:hypothetical protein
LIGTLSQHPRIDTRASDNDAKKLAENSRFPATQSADNAARKIWFRRAENNPPAMRN